MMFNFRYRSAAHFIEVFRTWYGPVHKAFAALPADALPGDALVHDGLALGGLRRPSGQRRIADHRRSCPCPPT